MTRTRSDFSSKRFASVSMLLVAILAVLAAGCSAPKAEEQDKDWTNADDLISTSDRIISVRFVQSQLQDILRIDPNTGASIETQILFRQFEVLDTHKGTIDPEDLLWIAFEPGAPGELVDRNETVKDFFDGPTYVLFLKGRLRPLENPTEFGPALWTGNGEPSFAELSGDRLLFRAQRTYVSRLEPASGTLPTELSAAPFELTLSDIEK